MEIVVLDRIPVHLTREDAEKRLHVTEEFSEDFEEIFSACIKVIRPKACFTQVDVEADGGRARVGEHTYDSRVMAVNFEGLGRCFPAVVTCGREIYDLGRSRDDILERFWVDGVAEMALGEASKFARDAIRERYGAGKLASMSPGSLPDYPITEQTPLFELLGDAPARVGVELTPGFLMLPHKSCSSLYFESERSYENCSLCLRKKCPGRRAPFDQDAYSRRFGLDAAQE